MGLFFFIERRIGHAAFANQFYASRIGMVEKMGKSGAAQALIATEDFKIAFNFGKRRDFPECVFLPAGHLDKPPPD